MLSDTVDVAECIDETVELTEGLQILLAKGSLVLDREDVRLVSDVFATDSSGKGFTLTAELDDSLRSTPLFPKAHRTCAIARRDRLILHKYLPNASVVRLLLRPKLLLRRG